MVVIDIRGVRRWQRSFEAVRAGWWSGEGDCKVDVDIVDGTADDTDVVKFDAGSFGCGGSSADREAKGEVDREARKGGDGG